MEINAQKNKQHLSIVMIISVLVAITWILSVWRFGFDLADEGYYWYGAQRMLHGEVPMRDFFAYDIGRYAWGALVMHLISNDGIVAVRLSAAIFQLATVSLGVWMIVRMMERNLSLLVKVIFGALVTILMNFWVYPYYKSFDFGSSILVIVLLTIIATSSRPRLWFGAGLILGLVAIIGRNHGVYGAFAAALLISTLWIKSGRPRSYLALVAAFIFGVIAGFSPTFVVALFVDGFAGAFITSVSDMVQSGATNISIPIPWPWTIVKDNSGWLIYLIQVAGGAAFIVLGLVPVIALLRLMTRPLSTMAVNERFMLVLSCAGIFYAHYASARADLTHVALSIVPVLLIVLMIGMQLGRPLVVAGLLLVVSFFILTPEKPYLTELILKKPLSTITVNGTKLRVAANDARRFEAATDALALTKSAKSNFLVLPNGPGLHAMLNNRMPIWEIYAVSKRSRAFEQREIARLEMKPPEMILLSDDPLDFKEERRYSRMHPLMYQWVLQHYHRIPRSPLQSSMWEVYVPNRTQQLEGTSTDHGG